jgi:TonB family protein
MSEYMGKSKAVGMLATVVFNGLIVLLCSCLGLKYLDPPPQEMVLLMEFEAEEFVPEVERVEVAAGVEPRSEVAQPNEQVRLVQRSQSLIEGQGSNQAEQATVGTEGDVEVPEPVRPVEINKRALFSAADDGENDTLAPLVADKVSNALAAGHSQGNTRTGNTEGQPSAKLAGRSIMGSLPLPSYDVQKSGKVVVRIQVDQEGNVTSAIAGDTGTTVTDQSLFKAAEKAALRAKFNISRNAPISQQGTITYIFNLR